MVVLPAGVRVRPRVTWICRIPPGGLEDRMAYSAQIEPK